MAHPFWNCETTIQLNNGSSYPRKRLWNVILWKYRSLVGWDRHIIPWKTSWSSSGSKVTVIWTFERQRPGNGPSMYCKSSFVESLFLLALFLRWFFFAKQPDGMNRDGTRLCTTSEFWTFFNIRPSPFLEPNAFAIYHRYHLPFGISSYLACNMAHGS